MRLIVAGGGTGGHVFGGVAVAQAWKKKYGAAAQILFVGAKGGIEEKTVPKAGFELKLLSLGSLKGASRLNQLRTLCLLPGAFFKSAWILYAMRPHAVIGVGGYASGPLVLSARILGWSWGCRVGILEQNSVPGLTNRVLGKFVHIVFTAFPGLESQFLGKRVVVSGNPVRAEMQPLPPAPERPFVIFIFGGSQGAKGINSLVLEALPFLQDIKAQIKIIHQTGVLDYERVRLGYQGSGFDVDVQNFIYDMVGAYQKSGLVICRAGSSTIFEIAAVLRPAIYIPFPFASDNHQEKNAQIMVDHGAAELMLQASTTGEQIAAKIKEFVNDPQKANRMRLQLKDFFRPDAADVVVRMLVDSELERIRSYGK